MPEAVQALVMRAGIVVKVTPEDRRRLEAIVGDRNAPQKHVWRAKIILATADGCGTVEIMRRSGKAKPVVWRWQERFMAEGVDGLTRDKMGSPANRHLVRHGAAGGRLGAVRAARRSHPLDGPDAGEGSRGKLALGAAHS